MPTIRGKLPDRPGWALYGGRLLANVPATVTITPNPNDRDPLDYRVVMTVDIVEGRLACTSLTAARLDEDAPVITGDGLRRIPVAAYLRLAGLELNVLLDRNGNYWSNVYMPPPDFARDGMTDEALDAIARVYAVVQATGGKPSGVLLSDYGMPRATSSRWLSVARRRGILADNHARLQWPASDQQASVEELDQEVEEAKARWRQQHGVG